MYRFYLPLFLFMSTTTIINGQHKTDAFLEEILKTNKSPLFQQVIKQPDVYRLQIIYTEINRDKKNKPSFKNYYFNFNTDLYFNPASMVKMPLALLALEKLNALKTEGVNKYTSIIFDSSQPWHRRLDKASKALCGLPSIPHFIKRTLFIT